MKPPATRKRWWIRLLVMAILAPLAMVVHSYTAAGRAARGFLFDSVDGVPPTRVAMVFGTTDRVNGRENLYFKYRIDAAEELWKSGKVELLILSGDSSTAYYNEPLKMRQALEARGVPGARIIEDGDGLSTLDSVVRAREIYGVSRIIFVSQRFQNERAIYLARANGMRAIGLNAQDVRAAAGYKTQLREIAARGKMWLDVHILKTRPSVLGKPIALP